MSKAVMYFDGSSSPRKKDRAGWGFVLQKDGEEISEHGALPPDSTNNFAEYTALIEGLKFALSAGVTDIHVIGDSQIVIYQMTGKYKVKVPGLVKLNSSASLLVKEFSSVKFEWKRRVHNIADGVSR